MTSGYYDEVVQYLLPIFNTLHEAQKQAPELWSTLGETELWKSFLRKRQGMRADGHVEQGSLSVRERLDGGARPAQLLAPARLVYQYDGAQEKGVNVDNGTGDFRGIEEGVFGQPARLQEPDQGSLVCGRTLVLGSFPRFWPVLPGSQKEEHRSIKYYPWYLEAARAFRAGVLASQRLDPMRTVLERATRRNGGGDNKQPPLRVLFIDRNIADNHEDHSTRNINNFAEAQAFVEKRLPGQFNFTVADWGVGSGLAGQLHRTHEHDIVVGSEGAGFANQVWLPLNAGVVQLHGKSYPKVFQWHTPISQYYGHSVVNVKLPEPNRVDPEVLTSALSAVADRMVAVEGRGAGAAFSQCITTSGDCDWTEDTCKSRNGEPICQVEVEDDGAHDEAEEPPPRPGQ